MEEMVGWYHLIDGHEFEQAPGDGGGQGSLMCCSQSMGSQRVGYDWLNLTECMHTCYVCNIMIIWSLYVGHIDKYAILVSGIIIHRSYWHRTLFWFQVYNITIWYILQNDYHNKSGEHPSLSEIVTIILLWCKFLLSLCRSALAEAWWWGDRPRQGSGRRPWVPGCEDAGAAEWSYPTSEVRPGRQSRAEEVRDEPLHVLGQEGQLWGDTPSSR